MCCVLEGQSLGSHRRAGETIDLKSNRNSSKCNIIRQVTAAEPNNASLMLEIAAQLQHTLMGHGCFGSKREMMKCELWKNTFGDRI